MPSRTKCRVSFSYPSFDPPTPGLWVCAKDVEERSSLLWAGGAAQKEQQKGKLVMAAFYGVQVFYSFFIM